MKNNKIIHETHIFIQKTPGQKVLCLNCIERHEIIILDHTEIRLNNNGNKII